MIDWETKLRDYGVLWRHDGNLARPFAQLTSGLISDTYFDVTYAVANPNLLAVAAAVMAKQLEVVFGDKLSQLVICGQMKGSVPLATILAAKINAGFIWTEKVGDGANKLIAVDERFSDIFAKERVVVLVEDTTTSGSTSALSREALQAASYRVSPYLPTFIDRTQDETNGFTILGCYRPDFPAQTWIEGNNPYTGGAEAVPPVRPKTAVGRVALRARYSS